MNSPFIATWITVLIFSGIFGLRIIIFLFGFVTLSVVFGVAAGHMSETLFTQVLLVSYLPVFISYLLWHSQSGAVSAKDRAYYDLANELNQVSTKAEVVINAIGDGVIAVNNQGHIDLINPAAQRITGWKKEDAIGQEYHTVLTLLGNDKHELPKDKDPVFAVLTNNQQQRASDISLKTSSEKALSLSLVASPIGRLGSGAIIVFRDITKERAEEHEQAEFISTASHEMRTPVASIEGYLGLALNPATATIDAKARDFITKAHEAAQHLGRLFQDLLDVSKADDGRLSNNPKVINVVSFTQGIIEDLMPKAEAKNLRIFFKPVTDPSEKLGGLPSVTQIYYSHVDADHFREVLSNLIENAIKYTPQGEVVVDVNGDDSHVVVSISDSGIGIPAEDIPHLFQKFYRVDNTDTREIGGTGLGLYLCRKLIEAMGGRIWVESEYKKGSTFFVETPRMSHEEANALIEGALEDDAPKITAKATAYIESPTHTQGDTSVNAATVLDTTPTPPVPTGVAPTPVATAPLTPSPIVAPVAPASPIVSPPVPSVATPAQRPPRPSISPPPRPPEQQS